MLLKMFCYQPKTYKNSTQDFNLDVYRLRYYLLFLGFFNIIIIQYRPKRLILKLC